MVLSSWLCLAASSMQRNCEASNNFLRIVKSAASCLVNKYTSILNMNNRNISNVSTQDSYLVSYNKTSNCSLNKWFKLFWYFTNKIQVIREGSGRLIYFIFLTETGKIQTRVDGGDIEFWLVIKEVKLIGGKCFLYRGSTQTLLTLTQSYQGQNFKTMLLNFMLAVLYITTDLSIRSVRFSVRVFQV